MNFRPSVPGNLEHWQVFRDDKQIIRFLNNLQEFSDFSVSYKEEGKNYVAIDEPIRNTVPRDLVALEQIFDRHDMSKTKEESIKLGDFVEVNIGTDKDPKMIKIGKWISNKESKRIIDLIQDYRDIIAFSYDEFKAYREDVIQHTIPLKEDVKPFRQKLRQINPKLAPMTQ